MNFDQQIYKAMILMDKGRENDAITCLKNCIEQAGENMLACARAHGVLGEVYCELEDYASAKEHFEYLVEHQNTLETLYDDALSEEIENAKKNLQNMNS